MVTEIVSVRLHKSPVPECRPKTKGQKTADKSAHIHSMAFLDNSRHATARLDKDSSAKNRVKIHYDDPYECLAHSIREQIENHNPKSIDSEYYLEYSRHIPRID